MLTETGRCCNGGRSRDCHIIGEASGSSACAVTSDS